MSTPQQPSTSPPIQPTTTSQTTLNPFHIAPPLGKQYLNDDLPAFSMVIAQHYIDPLTSKQFKSFFANSSLPLTDLPASQYTHLEKFFTLYRDLKAGVYDCRHEKISDPFGSFIEQRTSTMNPNNSLFSTLGEYYQSTALPVPHLTGTNDISNISAQGSSQRDSTGDVINKNEEEVQEEKEKKDISTTDPNSIQPTQPTPFPLTSPLINGHFLNYITGIRETLQVKSLYPVNNNDDTTTTSTSPIPSLLYASTSKIDINTGSTIVHTPKLNESNSTNSPTSPQPVLAKVNSGSSTTSTSSTSTTKSFPPAIANYEELALKRRLSSKLRTLITKSQAWAPTLHNPAFTKTNPIPAGMISHSTAQAVSTSRAYLPLNHHINDEKLVLNEFRQIIEPHTLQLNSHNLSMRCTITAHAIVFDIVNRNTDPFLFKNELDRNLKTTEEDNKNADKKDNNNNNQNTKYLLIPSCPVPLPLNTTTDTTNPYDLLNTPLSLQQLTPINLFSSSTSSSSYLPTPNHFNYHPLQPYQNDTTQNESSVVALHRTLYGSFSLKFIIPLGNILSAPIYKTPSLSFPYNINRALSTQYSSMIAKIPNLVKMDEAQNVSLFNDSGVLNALMKNYTTISNVNYLRDFVLKALSTLIGGINRSLDRITILTQYALVFNYTTAVAQHRGNNQGNLPTMSPSSQCPINRPFFTRAPQITSPSLSTLHISIPDDYQLVNLIKQESAHIRSQPNRTSGLNRSDSANTTTITTTSVNDTQNSETNETKVGDMVLVTPEAEKNEQDDQDNIINLDRLPSLQSLSHSSQSQQTDEFPISPGGTELRPEQNNKLDVNVPRELCHNPNNIVTFTSFVGLYNSFNHPITSLWQRQLDCLTTMTTGDYINNDNEENVEKSAEETIDKIDDWVDADEKVDFYQYIPQLGSQTNFGLNFTDLNVFTPQKLSTPSTNPYGLDNNELFVARPPEYPHYTRTQVMKMFEKMTKMMQQGEKLVLSSSSSSPRPLSLPVLLSLLNLLSSQIHTEASFVGSCYGNSLVAAVTLGEGSINGDIVLTNFTPFLPTTNPITIFSPTTSIYSILSLPLPRSLLVLANPHGGAGKALQQLKENLPLLHSSSNQVFIHMTTYGGEVRDCAKEGDVAFGWKGDPHNMLYKEVVLKNPLFCNTSTSSSSSSNTTTLSRTLQSTLCTILTRPAYDTVLLLSGDGLVSELLNGVMKSSYWGWFLRQSTICHVPCGSGNGISSSVNSISLANTNVENSFHFALQGSVRKVDMFTLSQDPKRPNGGIDIDQFDQYTKYQKAQQLLQKEKEMKQEQSSNTTPDSSPSQTSQSEEKQDGAVTAPVLDSINNTAEVNNVTDGISTSSGENEPVLIHKDFYTKFDADDRKVSIPTFLSSINETIPISTPLPQGTVVGALTLAWALISDLDFESEKWRFMAGLRFEFSALIRMAFLRKYQARVELLVESVPETDNSIVQGCDDEYNIEDAKAIDFVKHSRQLVPKIEPTPHRLSANLNLSQDNQQSSDDKPQHVACGMNCRVCFNSITKQLSLPENQRDISLLEQWLDNSLVFQSKSSQLTKSIGNIHGVHFIDGANKDNEEKKTPNDKQQIVPETWLKLYPSDPSHPTSKLSQTFPDTYTSTDTDILSEDYSVVWGFNVSHGATDAIGSPFSHLNNGFMDLYYIKNTTRMALLDMLTTITNGLHVNVPIVEHVQVKGFRLDPTVSCPKPQNRNDTSQLSPVQPISGGDINDSTETHSCLMSLDGERIPLRPIELRMWDGILNLICR